MTTIDANNARVLVHTERRKIQNRNAQRKYRNRRNQHRIEQASQPQELPQPQQQPQQAQQGPLDQLWAHQQGYQAPSGSGSWSWTNDPLPQNTSIVSISGPQIPETGYNAAMVNQTARNESTASHTTNTFDLNYSPSAAELNTRSYLSDLTKFVSHEIPTPFSMNAPAFGSLNSLHGLDTYGSTTAALDTTSNVPLPPTTISRATTPFTDYESFQPNGDSQSQKASTDEQLNTYVRQGSSMISSQTTTTGPLATNPTASHSNSQSPSQPSPNNAIIPAQDTLPILHIASLRGHASIVTMLLSQPHSSSIDIHERDHSGRTALHLAAMNGHESVARLLINHNARAEQDSSQHRPSSSSSDATDEHSTSSFINASDALGRTPLHWAALQKHQDVLNVLLDHGANVNCADAKDWTPLHAAAERGWAPGVQSLLRKGADLSLKARKCELWMAEEPKD